MLSPQIQIPADFGSRTYRFLLWYEFFSSDKVGNATFGIPMQSLLASIKLGSSNGLKGSWTVVESLESCPASTPER